MKKTRTLVFIGIFIAMNVVLVRLLSVSTPIVRFDFGFLPIALAAIMFGPIAGGITGSMADIAGMLLFPGGAYFPGFTASGFVAGAVYGLFLYNKQSSIVRTVLAVICVITVVDLGLNTLWLTMITGKAIWALLPLRLIKCAVMLPIEVALIHILWKYLLVYIKPGYAEQVQRKINM